MRKDGKADRTQVSVREAQFTRSGHQAQGKPSIEGTTYPPSRGPLPYRAAHVREDTSAVTGRGAQSEKARRSRGVTAGTGARLRLRYIHVPRVFQ